LNKIELKRQLAKCLLEAANPSKFLQRAFAVLCEAHPKTSFADLARKMGFSSRSFVRQLMIGNRRPNLQNCRQISQGLGLSSEASDYFELLIVAENQQLDPVAFDKKLNEAELKLRRSLDKGVRQIRKTDPIPFERWPFIYASLGSPKQGRTLPEIVEMSGQNKTVCFEILEALQKKEMIHWDSKQQRYFAKEEIIEIGELGNSKILKNLYKLIALETLRRVDSDLSGGQALFHSSVFSVRKEQMPQLTKDLNKVLSAYMCSAEDSEGQELAMLCGGLIPLRP